MKVVIVIPCYNEEVTLPLVIESIPKKVPGIDVIETLIVDDGSVDKTYQIAREIGVNHIIRNTRNKGLARSFEVGIDAALALGADIIVNTDGDNQYPQDQIPRLVAPILEGLADIVIADRQTHTVEHFSASKRFFQRLGSATVAFVSRTQTPDAVSGFRAYSREAALHLNVVTGFSYVIETIIQAGKKRLAISSVPIITNPKTRESRLFKNMFEHIKKSVVTIFRIYTVYEPFKTFFTIGGIVFGAGVFIGLRFLYILLISGTGGHTQSLILAAVLLIIGFQIMVLGVIADLIGINRKLLDRTLYLTRKQFYSQPKE